MLLLSFGTNGGPYREQCFDGDEVVIGRSEGVHLRFQPEHGVSGRHCRIFVDGDACWIEDLGSRNGIDIGDERVRRARLGEGTAFKVGHVCFKLERFAATRPREASPGAVEPLLSAQTELLPRDGGQRFSIAPRRAEVSVSEPEPVTSNGEEAARRRRARPDLPTGRPSRKDAGPAEAQPGSTPSPVRERDIPPAVSDQPRRRSEQSARETPRVQVWTAVADLVRGRSVVSEDEAARDAERWDELGRPAWFFTRELRLAADEPASEPPKPVHEYVDASRRAARARRLPRLWLGSTAALVSAATFAAAPVAVPPIAEPQALAPVNPSACSRADELADADRRAVQSDQWDPGVALLRALEAIEPVAGSSHCMHRSRAEVALREALTRLGANTLTSATHPIRQVVAVDGRWGAYLDTAGQLYWVDRFGQYATRALPRLASDIEVFAVSPDGARLAAGTVEGQLALWDLRGASGPTLLNTVGVHAGSISALAFSGDGTWVASADDRGHVDVRSVGGVLAEHPVARFTAPAQRFERLSVHAETRTVRALGRSQAFAWTWRDAKPSRTSELRAGSPFTAFDVSDDGALLVSGSNDGTVLVWPAGRTGKGALPVVRHDGAVQAVAVSTTTPRIVVSIGQAHTLKVSRLDGKQMHGSPPPTWDAAVVPQEDIDALELSRDGRYALARGQSGTLYSWDLGRYESTIQHRTLGKLASGPTMDLADDGTWALTSEARVLRGWDVMSTPGVGAWSVPGHSDEVTALAVSHDGTLALSGSRDRTAKLWRASPSGVFSLQATFELDDGVRAVVMDRDGRTAAVAAGSRLFLWDLTVCVQRERCDARRSLAPPEPVPLLTMNRLALSPDGRWLVAGDEAGHVLTWSLGSSGVERSWKVERLPDAIRSLDIDAAGQLVAAGTTNGELWSWPLDRKHAPQRLSLSRKAALRSLAFRRSPREELLVGGEDHAVHRLAVDGAGRLVADPPGAAYRHGAPVLSVATSGTWAVTASKSGELWLSSGAGAPIELPAHEASVSAVAFTPAGDLLLSVDEAGFLALWPLPYEDKPTLLRFPVHSGPVTALAVDGRGQFAFTGGADGLLRVSPLAPERLIEFACRAAGAASGVDVPGERAPKVCQPR